ncbi:MAG: hypothetical protein RI884_2941 [Pseudomonadota bacterium]
MLSSVPTPPSEISPLAVAEEALAGQVWRADALAGGASQALSSGWPALDAVLPGGGWPVGDLVEVLQARAQGPVWQLLAPALAQALGQQAGPVVLVGAPYPVFTPGLAALGLPPQRLLWVRAESPASRLWAAEQALRCTEVVAVLAWLPQVLPADLRRLHLAAQRHRRLLFALRPEAARTQASPARLRLALAPSEVPEVRVLKRRGPPLASPVCLGPSPAVLADLLRFRASPFPASSYALSRTPATALPVAPDRPHGLDRAATPA